MHFRLPHTAPQPCLLQPPPAPPQCHQQRGVPRTLGPGRGGCLKEMTATEREFQNLHAMTTLFLSRSHTSIARTISLWASACLSNRTVRLGPRPQCTALSAARGHSLQLHSQLHSPQVGAGTSLGSQPTAGVGTGWALRSLPSQGIL